MNATLLEIPKFNPMNNYPADWRWRKAQQILRGREQGWMTDADSAKCSDKILDEIVLPYLFHKQGYGKKKPPYYLPVEQAIAMRDGVMTSQDNTALFIETGILADLPAGDMVPPCFEPVPPEIQILYEALFFDVRSYLTKGVKHNLIAAVFCDEKMNAVALSSRTFAHMVVYGLGYREFLPMISGQCSVKATALYEASSRVYSYYERLVRAGFESSLPGSYMYHLIFQAANRIKNQDEFTEPFEPIDRFGPEYFEMVRGLLQAAQEIRLVQLSSPSLVTHSVM